MGSYQVETAHGAGKTDVRQAAFLLQLFRLFNRARMWQGTFIHTYDKDNRILQPFGCVQGDQRYCVIILFLDQFPVLPCLCRIRSAHQRNVLQEQFQGDVCLDFGVVFGNPAQFQYVGPAV